MIRVAIIDDHMIVRVGLKAIIEIDPDLEFAGELAGGVGAAAFVDKVKPDVVLLDIVMPDRDGIAALRNILEVIPSAKVLMLTTSEAEEDVFKALNYGAKGYLIKDRDTDSICRAIKEVAAGGRFIPDSVREIFNRRKLRDELTPRESQVLSLVAKGKTNQEIADALGVALVSVKLHVKHIMEKFGAQNRTELVVMAFRRGYAK